MSETPKCPGCGSEMKAVDFGREHLNFSFFCYECGWGSPLCDTAEEALFAALHRAETENRPMMLKEVRTHCAKGPNAEPLWIEFSRKTTLSRWILVAPNIECNEPATVTRYLDIWENDYGKTWRCWPRKPTPEQMAAEKWEE